MQEDEIYENLKKILNENYDVPIEQIALDLPLRLSLDSIDFLNFILDVKIQYDLNGNENAFLELVTLKDVVVLVYSSFK